MTFAPVAACSSFGYGLKLAMDAIQRGDAKAVVVGMTDPPPHPLVVGGFYNARVLAADGTRVQAADARCAARTSPAARWSGSSATCDYFTAQGFKPLGMEPIAVGVTRGRGPHHHAVEGRPDAAIQQALAAAGCAPADVGSWDMHATATPGDFLEVETLRGLLPESVLVTARKGTFGHGMSRRRRLGADGAVPGLCAGPALPDAAAGAELNTEIGRCTAASSTTRTAPRPRAWPASSPWAWAASTPASSRAPGAERAYWQVSVASFTRTVCVHSDDSRPGLHFQYPSLCVHDRAHGPSTMRPHSGKSRRPPLLEQGQPQEATGLRQTRLSQHTYKIERGQNPQQRRGGGETGPRHGRLHNGMLGPNGGAPRDGWVAALEQDGHVRPVVVQPLHHAPRHIPAAIHASSAPLLPPRRQPHHPCSQLARHRVLDTAAPPRALDGGAQTPRGTAGEDLPSEGAEAAALLPLGRAAAPPIVLKSLLHPPAPRSTKGSSRSRHWEAAARPPLPGRGWPNRRPRWTPLQCLHNRRVLPG